ncbi:hypothetical protein PB01_02155 [Psychrobacillus glaciei]|uniref:Uncharacterized protein n=1 Tax=Psychrobacillus glaciei TaxID=2283160 RepID=A0A5J6SJV8_9BACI|nr:hypothetical protein [Psychrobacillus glaciei]QFF97703.1 hypothetical protein PB01_02155 [Psychrobacillus glaciei]
MRQKKAILISIVTMLTLIVIVVLFYSQKEIGITNKEEVDSLNKVNDEELFLFEQEGKEISIPIKSIPLYEEYLNEQSNRNLEIQRTLYDFLDFHDSDGSTYILLKYSCGTKLYSTLLIKLSNEILSSIALGYDSIFMEAKQSPNPNYAVFLYGQNEGNQVLRNNLLAVDLRRMKLLTAINNEVANNYIDNAIWPITSFNWLNNHMLKIQTADILNSDYNVLLNWYESSMKTKEIQIEFNGE